MEDKKEKKERPSITNNFNAPIGQVINNVEHQEVHFDKDSQMQVQNVEEQHIEKPTEAAPEKKEKPKLTFAEAIPKCFRTDDMMIVWNKLRDEGLVDERYQLKTSKAAAHYIVVRFCQKRDGRRTAEKTWAPFEHFWNLSELDKADWEFSKADYKKINAVFENL